MQKQAAILSIGDELVLGQTVDTNSAWLSAKLAEIGIPTLYHQTVADDLPAIRKAIVLASQDVDLVILSGGLGPTEDDLTRQAMAEAIGVELVVDPEQLAHLERFFAGRGRPMPERNKVQTLHPRGTTMIPNSAGTAPGIKAKFGRATFYVTPGVPREMRVMYEKSIEPELLATDVRGDRGVILTRKINTFGQGESTIGERLGPLMDRSRNPKVGTTVANGYVSVRIRSEFPTREQAQAQLDDTSRQVNEALGAVVFGTEEETLQESVVALLERSGYKLVTAESCTGGLVGRMITDVSGSSLVYDGGWVTYANSMKVEMLGVPIEMIERHGAVSEEVAIRMAKNALQRSRADMSLAITGIAGPTGGTLEKPVGTVWIAFAIREPGRTRADDVTTQAVRFQLGGDRDTVRDRAAKCALQMVRLHLMNQPITLLDWGRVAPAPAAQPG